MNIESRESVDDLILNSVTIPRYNMIWGENCQYRSYLIGYISILYQTE